MNVPIAKISAVSAKVGQKVSNFAGITGLKFKAASPEIFLGCSIISMAGAVISGIISARKHDELIMDHNERLEIAKAEYIYPDGIDLATAEYFEDEDKEEIVFETADGTIVIPKRTEKEIARAVRKEYLITFVRFAKLYSITGGLMAFSTFCGVKMHNIQAGRIAGLSGAYTALQGYISQYEKRNIELNGEKNHQMCKYGYHEETIVEETASGKKKKIKSLEPNTAADIHKIDPGDAAAPVFHDQYHEFSRNTSQMYTGTYSLDLWTLNRAQAYVLDRLDKRGWVTVNDVLDGLDLPRTPEGMIEGWVKGYGPTPDLGIYEPVNQRFHAGFPNEPVLLDFNVHGNVFQILKDMEKKSFIEKIAAKEGEVIPDA